MSDKATELQGILDEFEHECFMLRVEATETRAGADITRMSYERIRDEFAGRIAATLGRPKAKSHPYGYERDTGCYDCTRCECGCINDISAKYCNDCGGEIEIDESAEKEYYDGYSKHTVFAKKHDDGSLEFCERRYVPEDSATPGSGREAELVRAMEDVLRHSTDPVWVGEAETLVDRMVSLGVYGHDVYDGARPWEVD